jgi:hypothetical protein
VRIALLSDIHGNTIALDAVLAEIAASFAWTAGCVSAGGWTPWLEALPTEARGTLPDGTRLLGVHATPGRDDGPGINPVDTDDDLDVRMGGCDAVVPRRGSSSTG